MKRKADELKQRLADLIGGGYLQDKKAAKKSKLTVTLPNEVLTEIADLQGRLDTEDPAVVVRHALALFAAVLQQFDDGRVLVFRDPGNERRPLITAVRAAR